MMIDCVGCQDALGGQQVLKRGDSVAQARDLGDEGGDDGGQAVVGRVLEEGGAGRFGRGHQKTPRNEIRIGCQALIKRSRTAGKRLHSRSRQGASGVSQSVIDGRSSSPRWRATDQAVARLDDRIGTSVSSLTTARAARLGAPVPMATTASATPAFA